MSGSEKDPTDAKGNVQSQEAIAHLQDKNVTMMLHSRRETDLRLYWLNTGQSHLVIISVAFITIIVITVCVCVCVRACVRACVRVCVCVRS